MYDKNPINSMVLNLQVLHSLAKCQSTCFSVMYGARALKICHDTEHQKVAQQHLNLNIVT